MLPRLRLDQGMIEALCVGRSCCFSLAHRCVGGVRGNSQQEVHRHSDGSGFAAGALLAMISDTMLPEAYDVEAVSTGWLVAIGFSISLMLSVL